MKIYNYISLVVLLTIASSCSSEIIVPQPIAPQSEYDLIGRVTDADSGEPIEGIRVAWAYTDEDGWYHATGLTLGPNNIYVCTMHPHSNSLEEGQYLCRLYPDVMVEDSDENQFNISLMKTRDYLKNNNGDFNYWNTSGLPRGWRIEPALDPSKIRMVEGAEGEGDFALEVVVPDNGIQISRTLKQAGFISDFGGEVVDLSQCGIVRVSLTMYVKKGDLTPANHELITNELMTWNSGEWRTVPKSGGSATSFFGNQKRRIIREHYKAFGESAIRMVFTVPGEFAGWVVSFDDGVWLLG